MLNKTASVAVIMLSVPAAASALTVSVLDRDTKLPISATVSMKNVGPPPMTLAIGDTQMNGVMTNALAKCALGSLITVQPLDANYSAPLSPTPCTADAVTIYLRSKSRIRRIELVAIKAEQNQDYGIAAQALSELAAERNTPSIQAAFYKNTAKVLGVDEGEALNHDPQQGKPVASRVLINALKEYQEDKGLNVTGAFDSKTLAAMGNGSVAKNVLFGGVQ